MFNEINYFRAKTKLQKKHRELENLKKAASEIERTTRRRTKFDFDLWSDMDNVEAKKVNENDWLDLNTKNHTLKNTRNLQRKAPEDLLENPSDLKAVEGNKHGRFDEIVFLLEMYIQMNI